VAYAGVCGTDLHVDDWYPAYHFMAPHLPVTLGHEFSGTVEATGPGVSGLAPGDRVVVRPSTTCGQCAACLAGHHDRCRKRRGIGLTRDGAFAPCVIVPARNCLPLPAGLRSDVAALAEPFSIAWQAMRRAAEHIGMQGARILVLGPGIIGQAIAVLARREGADVRIVGKSDATRCNLLRRAGFTHVADLDDPEGESAVGDWGEFDAVFEATGSPQSIAWALPRLAPGGVLVVTGIHPRPLQLDLTALVRQEHVLAGSFRAPESAWPEVLGVLVELQADIAPLVTHRMPISLAQEAFDLAKRRAAGKVLLMPQEI
jgi:threonine dehydrogenase-like Zn-dependent dehydrogenase